MFYILKVLKRDENNKPMRAEIKSKSSSRQTPRGDYIVVEAPLLKHPKVELDLSTGKFKITEDEEVKQKHLSFKQEYDLKLNDLISITESDIDSMRLVDVKVMLKKLLTVVLHPEVRNG